VKKTIILLFFFVLAGFISANGQSHSNKPNCRYFKDPPRKPGEVRVTDWSYCLVCFKQEEDEIKARQAENKRRAEVAAAEAKAKEEKIKADRVAADEKQKKEVEERKQREEMIKELDEYSRNQQRYLDNLKIDINKNYLNYDAVKASQTIPVKLKMLKLVENRFAKTYELYSGEELVKSYSQEQYWVYQLNKDLPYFIISEKKSKTNRVSIVDSKGDAIAISGEKYFQFIQFNDKNNTIQFEVALEVSELLYRGGSSDRIEGIYNVKADVKRLISVIELEKEKRRSIPDEVDSRGTKTVKLGGFAIDFNGYSAKRIVAGLDLTVLESSTVYRATY